MTYYSFPTVEDARKAGLSESRIDEIINQVATHRQVVSADKARRKKTRKAARLARRAGRA